jgi:superfamily II DNA or RNA helicase
MSEMSYAEFLSAKRRVFTGRGIADGADLPAALYDWQAAIVRWALRKGRAAIFADCGLGKTFMQIAWADALQVPTLILAPLCVAEQTVAEAAKLGIAVHYAQDRGQAQGHRLVITNYERLDKFDPADFQAVVLDESSILKAFNGKTRTALIEAFQHTPYRLCCTATPSPNDIAELANHAEFLGLMTRPEFLATWFINIQSSAAGKTKGWRMKRYAVEAFYRWMASWAVAVRSPADLGYDDRAFRLPALTIHDEILPLTAPVGDALFPEMGMKGLSGRLAARRTALDDRVARLQRLTDRDGQWLLWCGLNTEADALTGAIDGAVNVAGSDSYSEKVGAVQAFVRGDIRVLVSKAKILGFGMNFQHCHQMAFVGLSDSYETYYQCIRRCWRYGQRAPVSVHIVVSEAEGQVVANVRRKEAAAATLADRLLTHMQGFEREEVGVA